jgi:hypothetical protein
MIRNILCFDQEPKISIINFFNHWPFQLSNEQVEIIKDNKKPHRFPKKNLMVEYAVTCLMNKGDWELEEEIENDEENEIDNVEEVIID